MKKHIHEWEQGKCRICGRKMLKPKEIGKGRGGDIYLDMVDAKWDIMR